MRLCIVSDTRIDNCKRLFKLRGKNTEDQLTSNDWTVINYILEQLKESESKWISLKEISTAVMLCDEDEDDPRKLSEKSKHARNIISKLNLATDKGRVAGKGNVRFLFEKSRVKEIEANYLTPTEEENPSQIITSEENQVNTNEF